MAYRGSCPDMCPESERHARFGLYMSIFERGPDNLPIERAMVKEYRRSGADQEEPAPEDLRTPRALELTMDYLVSNILDDPRSKAHDLAIEWYDFLWDRLRAIRKDITQQNICDQASALLVERCARFHVHSCYAMPGLRHFDVDMNKRNLNDCLQMLRQMYHDLKVVGLRCPGELEFQKYDILLHLSEDHLSSVVLMKTSDYRETQEMKFITQIFNAYTNSQYYKFFHLMESADYMTSCILSLYANKMRLLGFKTIVNACAPRQATLYPVHLLIRSLGFDDLDDLKLFALAMGIDIQEKEDEGCFLVLNKDTFQSLRRGESQMKPYKSVRLVESKTQGKPIGLLVDGREELPRQTTAEQEMDAANDQQMIFEETTTTPIELNITEQEVNNHHRYMDEDFDGAEDLDDTSSKKRKSAGSTHTSTHELSTTLNDENEENFYEEEETRRRKRCKVKQVDEEKREVVRKESAERRSVKRSREEEFLQGVTLDLDQREKDIDGQFKEVPKRRRAPQTQEPEQGEIGQVPSRPAGPLMHAVTEIAKEAHKSPVITERNDASSSDTSSDEMLEEPMLRERTRRVLYRRQHYKRDRIADMMPAGCYKVRSLKTRVPKLDPPPQALGREPPPRCKLTNSPQRSIDSLAVSIEDEAKANEMFSQFIEEFDNSIST